jgi:uncharacterized protein with HEPN domain
MRDDLDRLRDIRQAIDRIFSRTSSGVVAFRQDEMLQVWVLHHLQIIGEAARALSSGFLARHPDKVWKQATGMRNILVHHYFEIELDRVWNVVESDLPLLKRRVQGILASSAWVICMFAHLCAMMDS